MDVNRDVNETGRVRIVASYILPVG